MSETSTSGERAPRRRRVLIVDDVRSDRERIGRWLSEDGYVVTSASSPDEARAVVAEARPDCIVLDYVLGEESGLDLLADLSPPDAADRVPVVLLTGAGHTAVAEEALRRGAEDCLLKGAATSDVVRHAVRSAIERSSVRRTQAREERAEAETRLSQQIVERRASYLAEATRKLASATDVDTTLDRLARLAVPFLADRVVIDLVDRSGVPTHHTVVDAEHSEHPPPRPPQREHQRAGGRGRQGEGERQRAGGRGPHESVLDAGHPIGHVLRTGDTQVHVAGDGGDIDPALRTAVSAPDDDALHAVLIVPLLHAGDPMGTMAFVSFDRLRSYDAAERLAAEEIALRGSLAIGNARGVASQRRAQADVAGSTRMLRSLAAISTTLSRPLARDRALDRVVHQSVPALGALAAVSLTVDGALEVVAEHADHEPLPDAADDRLREVRATARTDARATRTTVVRDVPFDSGRSGASLLAVPLLSDDRVVGVYETMAVGADGITDDVRTIAEDVARRVAAYLGRLQAAERQDAVDAALRSSEQKLQLALGAAGAGVFEIHGEPLVVDLDDAHAKLWGFPADVGQVSLDDAFVHMAPEGRRELRQQIVAAFDEGAPFELEYRTRGGAGDRWLLSRGQQLAVGAVAEEPRLVGVTLDVSERHRLTERITRDGDRTRRLQQVTAALSGAVDRAGVAAAVRETVAPAAEAADVVVLLQDDTTVGQLPADGVAVLDALRDARDVAAADAGGGVVEVEVLGGATQRWYIVLPLHAAGTNVGAMALCFDAPPDVDEAFRPFLVSLTRQIAVALDRAALFERERQIAESLQHRLLPQRLPDRGDADLAARYLPANTDVQVGGDWYDAIELDDGGFVFAVGDVMGHGVAAASAMGQLRIGLRALVTVDPSPAAIVAAADRLAGLLLTERYATVCIGRVTPADGGGTREVRLANAGHQPVLLVAPDGSARWIDIDTTVPIGVAEQVGLDDPAVEATVTVDVGSTLLLYTDGLVERPGEDIDAGYERLRAAAEDAFHDPGEDVDEACQRLIDAVIDTERRADDIALLAVRVR
jgi:serine phosphatase RsbU (regulator of sigma subunit)/FixJ family two-component response regulator